MRERKRRLIAVVFSLLIFLAGGIFESRQKPIEPETPQSQNVVSETQPTQSTLAIDALEKLPVKGRAPKTGYDRAKFSNGWGEINGCSVRELVLLRDLKNTKLDEDGCRVLSGTLDPDPYSNKVIQFQRGINTSQAVQIDHVVAVSDAWQKGAQQLTPELRYQFYNDPLNHLAVDGPTNNDKGDGDAATWLPPNKDYRCRYVARQIAVKQKYSLWVTSAEHDAIKSVLATCPEQVLPIIQTND
jgi:hypothetical protein